MSRVLVIDDEQMIRWSIEQTVGAAGYDVVTAETAAEGLALFRELHPAVVFLDVRLPDANGLSVLKHINDASGPPTAVIVMTAFEEDCSVADAVRLGACGYLKKPFNFDELQTIVGRAVETIRV
jgi:two-component system response regulator AtoC